MTRLFCRFLPVLFLGSCTGAEEDSCEDMCLAAADLYGGCLQEWGEGWETAGYTCREDYIHSCNTWAWETKILATDVGAEEVVQEVCLDRAALFESGECSDYTSVDWNEDLW